MTTQSQQSNNAINRFHKTDESHAEYIETILYRARNGIPTTKTHVFLPLITEDDLSILRVYLADAHDLRIRHERIIDSWKGRADRAGLDNLVAERQRLDSIAWRFDPLPEVASSLQPGT